MPGPGPEPVAKKGLGARGPLRILRLSWHVTWEAFDALTRDDGWAIASHIALSTLMSLFPFLIFVTALAGYFGTEDLADQAAIILLDAWPEEVAGPIASEIASVLTIAHGGLLTVGVILAIYFSSSGIESLRIGLNRAYNVVEMRSWWVLRLESIAYVLVGAVALIALSFLILLGPLIFATAVKYARWLEPLEPSVTYARFGITTVVLVITLILVHKWLPAGRRTLREIAPGIIVTILLWLITGVLFGRYLAEFSSTYVATYAGLASAMVALVFLYCTATIFVYGGELNAAIKKLTAEKGDGLSHDI